VKRVELRELKQGDVFSLYRDSPALEILGARAPELKTSGSYQDILMMLSGNVYTLRRVDGAGGDEPFEITLDALQYVWVGTLRSWRRWWRAR
jgi:hypothetical protein